MSDVCPSIRFNAVLKDDYRLEREVVRGGLDQEKKLTVGDKCYLMDLHRNLS